MSPHFVTTRYTVVHKEPNLYCNESRLFLLDCYILCEVVGHATGNMCTLLSLYGGLSWDWCCTLVHRCKPTAGDTPIISKPGIKCHTVDIQVLLLRCVWMFIQLQCPWTGGSTPTYSMWEVLPCGSVAGWQWVWVWSNCYRWGWQRRGTSCV